ncbi:response regulator transcription factor [Thalassotalea fonticola]|uniref:Response regulator transcription factor n=1 Tax=Thalassotalea fonticola TaxID=3065649 RepID=A0ABZ0GR62_9GAMM|nr:response regulator transcription factor [Colwelliaceae bacterium S1-1]
MRILLVEDDYQLGESLVSALSIENYAVDLETDGAKVIPMLNAGDYDMMVLDLGLPNVSGDEILKKLRAADDPMPVLVLTARNTTADMIESLDLGADDYLTKPFDIDELFARLRSLHRRSSGRARPVLISGDVELEPKEQVVTKAGIPVTLTAKELSVLEALMSRAGRFVSKSRLEEGMYTWGDEVESNTVEVYISRLRKYFGSDFIETLRSVGYRVKKG